MKVADIIPITRGAPKEPLTYFTTLPIQPGTVVEITIQNRTLPGLVIAVRDARQFKTTIKAAGYAIKKINRIIDEHFFKEPFLTAVFETAHYFIGAPGTVLKLCTPTIAFTQIDNTRSKKIPIASKNTQSQTKEKKYGTQNTVPDILAVQANNEERFGHYRNVIRSEFAKKKTVLITVPTIEEAVRLTTVLKKGIEQYTILFHGRQKKSEQLSLWKHIDELNHPLVIIGTPHILAVPRDDIGTIIVEREASPLYRLQSHPFPDVRFFAERLAKKAHARFILGDALLKVETVKRVLDGTIAELSPLQWRSLDPTKIEIADMRTTPEPATVPHQRIKKPFTIIGDSLRKTIEEARTKNARMVIFVHRKGFATTTVCADCGSVVSCTHCSSPVTLKIRTNKENQPDNFFVCNKCGLQRSAAERCVSCDGWRLVPLGIGTETVAQALTEAFPNTTVIKIDKDATKTDAIAQKALTQFKNTPGSILLGTELSLLMIDASVEYTAVASIDSLFALPDFRIAEKAFSILVRLRGITNQKMIIQTRMPDIPLFEYLRSGNLIDFFKQELSERKMYNYPPEQLLIKISTEGNQEKIYALLHEVKKHLEKIEYKLEIYPAFIRTIRNKFVLHGLIRMPPEKWPNQKLHSFLQSLGKEYIVRVDPESLL